MKYCILFASLLSCFLFSSCRKQVNLGPVYSGKIIKSVCGSIVVQVTDGSNLGQASWNDDGTIYKNVFTVANPCTWNPTGTNQQNIKFHIVGAVPQSCAVCLIAVSVPDAEYHIVVEK